MIQFTTGRRRPFLIEPLPKGSSLPEVRSKARPSDGARGRPRQRLATVRNASAFVRVAPNSFASRRGTSRVSLSSLGGHNKMKIQSRGASVLSLTRPMRTEARRKDGAEFSVSGGFEGERVGGNGVERKRIYELTKLLPLRDKCQLPRRGEFRKAVTRVE